MCQLQFIKRKHENLSKKEISEFFKLMEFGSLDNHCAFGFFNDKTSFKAKGRFNLGTFFDNNKLLNSNFIIGHNRLATTGTKENNRNNHPFEVGDFVLVHNGVIENHKELRIKYNINSKIKTDSFVILWLIEHFFKKSKLNNRVERIAQAVKKTTKKLNGYYSVFLYDKINNDIYYFKNSLTEFSFCLFDDSLLVGTTNPRNLEHLFLNERFVFNEELFEQKKTLKIDDNTLYLINDSEFIKEIAKFETTDGILYNQYSHSLGTGGFLEIEEEIQEMFYNALGYIPDFKFNAASGNVRLPYNEALCNDLSYFIPRLFNEKGHIFFNVNELTGSYLY